MAGIEHFVALERRECNAWYKAAAPPIVYADKVSEIVALGYCMYIIKLAARGTWQAGVPI